MHLQAKLSDREKEVSYLKEQFAWFKRQIFGNRSERIVANLNEQQLFLEGFENLQTPQEEVKTVAAHTRRKAKREGQDKIALSPDRPV